MTPVLLGMVAGIVLASSVVAADILWRRTRIRLKNRNFERNRVTLEEVTPFAAPKCRTCKGTGEIRRYADPRAPVPVPTPCGCAAREFMRQHKDDTEMFGQFRLWKRGRGPRRGSHARAGAGVASARTA